MYQNMTEKSGKNFIIGTIPHHLCNAFICTGATKIQTIDWNFFSIYGRRETKNAVEIHNLHTEHRINQLDLLANILCSTFEML